MDLSSILKNYQQLPREYFDKLLQNPSAINLKLLNLILPKMIPFNAPHGFKLKEITATKVCISLPHRRINHNHLGGVHACAMATLGEFCSGLSLIRNLGFSQYRIILSELNVKYLYQGKSKLKGVCEITPQEINAITTELQQKEKITTPRQTYIKDANGQDVAVVTAHWQLKNWEHVKS